MRPRGQRDQRLGRTGLELISVSTPSAREYVQTDRLGSAVLGSDPTGAVSSRIAYDEWGCADSNLPGAAPAELHRARMGWDAWHLLRQGSHVRPHRQALHGGRSR
jgi:hypothetical protein